MKRMICIAFVLAGFTASVFSNDEQILVNFELYRIRGDISGKTSLTDDIWAGLERPKFGASKGPFSFFTLAESTLAKVELKADNEGWKWNGKDKPPSGSGIETLVRPMVLVEEGNSFQIHVQSDQPIEYFEKREDGLFEHKTLNETAGISMSAKIEKGIAERITLRNLTMSSKMVTGRESIEGVTLNVGRPTFNEERLTVSISLKPGRDYGVSIRSKKEGFLLLRLRVERLQKGALEKLERKAETKDVEPPRPLPRRKTDEKEQSEKTSSLPPATPAQHDREIQLSNLIC